MRIWDIPVWHLCDKHLRGEHVELHIIWNAHTLNKIGWRNHPETRRWTNYLYVLWMRHEAQIFEMSQRGWNHKSYITHPVYNGGYPDLINSIEEQYKILEEKKCACWMHWGTYVRPEKIIEVWNKGGHIRDGGLNYALQAQLREGEAVS